MNNKILITGGAGYIGSHTCKALARTGYEPVVFDNLCRGHAHAVRWGPLVEGDLLDRESLAEAFRRYRPASVLHFAAFAYVGESVQDPLRYYRNNMQGSLNLIEAMLAHDCRRIVLSSTCAVYGEADGDGITEDHSLAPINPYGRSKLMVEQMLRDSDSAYSLRSVALRYFNAAGSDPEGDVGEEHDPEIHLIPLVLQAATSIRGGVDIYGTDYATPDGTAIRDYTHVSDLADAHVAALAYLESGGATIPLNLGTGTGYSVREVIECARRVTDRPSVTRETPRRPGDPPMLVAKASRANATLGWRPRFTSLDDIVETAWSWQLRLTQGKWST